MTSKLSLPSQRAVTASLSVNRLVAGRFERFASVKQYTDIVEANKSDVAVAAARLGRAVLLHKNVPQAALKDLNAVLGSSAAAEYHHMATALRMKLNNRLLEVAEAQLVASGGDAEEGVADLRKAVQTDLDTIAKNRPDCMLVKMARAEMLLMEAKYDEALPLLKEVTDNTTASSSSTSQGDGVVSITAQNAGAVLALYRDGGNDTKEAPKELMDALKDSVKLPQAKTEELLALSEVLRGVATSHVYVDFFAPSEEYSVHYEGNMAALFCESNLAEDIAAYQGPRSGADVLSPEKVNSSLRLSSTVIDDFDKWFAETKSSKVGKLLEGFTKQRKARQELFNNSSSLEALVNELKTFLRERAKLDTVLVLEQQNKLTEAKELIEKCHNAPLWKKLMLGGRIKRACGSLAEADKDFEELFKLRKTHGFDVPPVDTFRTRSVF